MNKEELINVSGGGISSTMINAFARGVTTIYELGRSLGSALRRIVSGKTCAV